jgi:hypothetical protein
MMKPSIRLTRALKTIGALALVGAIVVIVAQLASAPLYARYDAAQCRDAYAKARTHHDTVAVDLHPFGKGRQSTRRTCGEIRSVAVVTDSVAERDTICLAGRIGLPCRP